MLPVLEFVAPVVVTTLVIGGVCLLWTRRVVVRMRRQRGPAEAFVAVVGWSSLLAGLLAILVGLLAVFVIPAMLVIGLSLLVAWSWKRRGDRKQLLWCLDCAAQYGLPLPAALRALADERMDAYGTRIRRLATLVEQGRRLPDAIRATVRRTTLDGDVALHVGDRYGLLRDTLSALDEEADEAENLMLSAIEGTCYVLLLAVLFCLVMLRLRLAVVPVLDEMQRELAIGRSAAPVFFSLLSRAPGAWLDSGMLVVALAAALAATLLLLLLTLRHLELLPQDWPLLARLAKPLHRARILRGLAAIVQGDRTMHEALVFLGEVYPRRWWRRRLTRAADSVAQGRDWLESLRTCGIASPADAPLLQAAQRTGHLDWALRELAVVVRRRYIYRMRLLSQVLWPVVIVVAGLAFAALALAVFVPLVQLIHSLA